MRTPRTCLSPLIRTWMGAALLLLPLGLLSCSGADQGRADEVDGEEELPISVGVEPVRRAEISRFVPTAGNLQAEQEAVLVAEAGGMLVTVPFEEGEVVERGAVVSQLEDEDLRLQAERARLVRRRDENELARVRKLYERELLAHEEFEAARTRAEISATDLRIVEERLEQARVRAPFKGVLAELYLRAGQSAAPGAAVARLVAIDPLHLPVFLPEEDVAELQLGQPVQVLAQGSGENWQEGRILLISPVVDPSTGTVKVTVEVDNEDRSLRPGAFARARVIIGTRPAVLQVPEEAVLYEARIPFVYSAQADTVARRELQVGWTADGWTEVVAGLEEGAPVIVSGKSALRVGDRIKVIEKEEPAAVAAGDEAEQASS